MEIAASEKNNQVATEKPSDSMAKEIRCSKIASMKFGPRKYSESTAAKSGTDSVSPNDEFLT